MQSMGVLHAGMLLASSRVYASKQAGTPDGDFPECRKYSSDVVTRKH
jgi:hypothetical protein